MRKAILKYFPDKNEGRDHFDRYLDLGMRLQKARNEMAPLNYDSIHQNTIECALFQREFSIDAIIKQDLNVSFFFESYLTQFIEKAGAPSLIAAGSDYESCNKVLAKWKLGARWSLFLGFYGKEVVLI